MLKKALKQYLELIKLSGIEEVFLDVPLQSKKLLNSKKEPFANKSLKAMIEAKHISALEKKKEIIINPVNIEEDFKIPTDLIQLAVKYSGCKKCLLSDKRTNFVYGEGNPHAKLMLIGEGPGEEEDKTGRPFVGKAGQLLEKMLAAINIRRDDVYIANIVKCRPPNNRNPLENEVNACLPYLVEQITVIKPRILLLLGKVAATNLLQKDTTLTVFRTDLHKYMDIQTYVTYHPAALLRNPDWKKLAWIDLQRLQKVYETLL